MENIERLTEGYGLSPGDLEDCEDLYFSGECDREEAVELYDNLRAMPM